MKENVYMFYRLQVHPPSVYNEVIGYSRLLNLKHFQRNHQHYTDMIYYLIPDEDNHYVGSLINYLEGLAMLLDMPGKLEMSDEEWCRRELIDFEP